MKTFSAIVIGLAMLLAFAGVATAAVLPPATNETQGITSTTVVQCDGIVITSANYANENSNQVLNGAPLAAKEIYGASAYNSQMIALNGATSLVKVAKFNTKNQVIDGKNIDVATDLLFTGEDGGFVTGDESIAQFNAGQTGTKAGDVMLCPFSSTPDSVIPPYNEAVVMGSKYDMYYGTVATQAGATTTAKTGDVPSNTQYSVTADGAGSITAYMSLFAQDARGNGTSLVTPASTTKIPGKTTTTVVTPGTTTVVTVPGHYEKDGRCEVWVPTKTTTVTTKDITSTVTTKDQTINNPAVYTPVTPSAVTSYKESTTAMGKFTFAKVYGYTSGI
jgi:hypothetical protein